MWWWGRLRRPCGSPPGSPAAGGASAPSPRPQPLPPLRMAASEPHALSGDGRRKRPIPTSTTTPAPTDGGRRASCALRRWAAQAPHPRVHNHSRPYGWRPASLMRSPAIGGASAPAPRPQPLPPLWMEASEPHALSGDGRRKRPSPASTTTPAPTDGGLYHVQVTPETFPSI